MNTRNAIVLCDLQYGSTGKGVVGDFIGSCAYSGIRTGGPQAGHTCFVKGNRVIGRQIPILAAGNTGSLLFIGPGAVVNADVLMHEIEELESLGIKIRDRLYIHENAVLVTHIHAGRETGLVDKIGSTAEGTGACRADRIMRRASPVGEDPRLLPFTMSRLSYLKAMEFSLDNGIMLLEGHQGFGLSLWHGAYPFVTSGDTTASSIISEAGIPFQRVGLTIGVLRAAEIRVGGNSGPMAHEAKWEDFHMDPQHTTVTGRVRRVGHFDDDIVGEAIMVNKPDVLALTHLDMIDPEKRVAFIGDLECKFKIPVAYIRYGEGHNAVKVRFNTNTSWDLVAPHMVDMIAKREGVRYGQIIELR